MAPHGLRTPVRDRDREDATFATVIRHDTDPTNGMDDVVRAMHERSGLLAELQARGESAPQVGDVEDVLLKLSEDWPTDKETRVMLAGNSVHFDLSFLRVHMPTFAKRLSYRVLDASGFYRGCLTAGMPELPKHEEAHRAMADVERSIELMRECVGWMHGGAAAH